MGKVTQVTFGFWMIKIIAPALGAVGGNAVTLTLGLGYLVGMLVFSVPIVIAVIAQIRTKLLAVLYLFLLGPNFSWVLV